MGDKASLKNVLAIATDFFSANIYPKLGLGEKIVASWKFLEMADTTVAALRKHGVFDENDMVDLGKLERFVEFFTANTPSFTLDIGTAHFTIDKEHIYQIFNKIKETANAS